MSYTPKVGDKVILRKIEGKSNSWNAEGRMDKWINTVQEIEKIDGERIFFVGGGSHVNICSKDILNSWTWRMSNNSIFPLNRKIFKLKFITICNT